MAFRLKKVGASGFVSESINVTWPNVTGPLSWSIKDSKDKGNIVNFEIHNIENKDVLERGAFYQLFNCANLNTPITVFELTDISQIYKTKELNFYECEGRSWRNFLEKRAWIVDLELYKVSFKELCEAFLSKLRLRHSQFSADTSKIQDLDVEFGQIIMRKQYGLNLINFLENQGYKIYFDNNLVMHAEIDNSNLTGGYLVLSGYDINNNTQVYQSIEAQTSINIATTLSNAGVSLGVNQYIFLKYLDPVIRDYSNINSFLTVDIANNSSANLNQFFRSQVINIDNSNGFTIAELDRTIKGITTWIEGSGHILCLDDTSNYQADDNVARHKLFNQEFPAQEVQVTSNNVIDTVNTTEITAGSSAILENIILNKTPAPPSRVIVEFNGSDNNLIGPELNPGDDEIENNGLNVNSIPGRTILAGDQYRNYSKTVDNTIGFTVGGSFRQTKADGSYTLFTLKDFPNTPDSTASILFDSKPGLFDLAGGLFDSGSLSDPPADVQLGFRVDDSRVSYIYQGREFTTDFEITPTIRTQVTAINNNVLTVTDSSGYQVGETVLFTDNNTITGDVFAIITNVSLGQITLDRNISFSAGLEVLQIADYIAKYVVHAGRVTFYIKRETDEDFTALANIIFNGSNDESFVRFYSNEECSLFINYVDIVDDEYYSLVREGGQEENDLDIDLAFDAVASDLESIAQIVEVDNQWQVRFLDTVRTIIIIQSVLNDRQLVLAPTELSKLSVSDRCLINGQLLFVQSIDTSTNIVTFDRDINNVSVENGDFIIKSKYDPAIGQSYDLSYRSIATETVKLCGCDDNLIAIENQGYVEELVLEDVERFVEYEEFREAADIVRDRYCDLTLRGSFIILVDAQDFGQRINKYLYGLKDYPLVGQEIILKTSYYPELHNKKGVISSITVESFDDYKLQVTYELGNPQSFNKLLYQAVNTERTSIDLIGSSNSEPEHICLAKEIVCLEDGNIIFSDGSDSPFNVDTYNIGIARIGENQSYTYTHRDRVLTLFDDKLGLFDSAAGLFDLGSESP